MYCVILISIIIIALSHGQTCTSTCSYIYDNRTGNYTASNPEVKELWKFTTETFRTGVYTVIGQFSCPEGKDVDYLRFRKQKYEGWIAIYEPLIMRLYNDRAEFYAEEWNDASNKYIATGLQELKNLTKGTEMSLQISDHVQDRYSIYLNTRSINYTYKNNWDDFSDQRLDTINNVYSDLDCLHYKYIMVCDDLNVEICDVSEPSEKLELGQTYSILCGGTGSPLLKITWAVQYEFGENKDVLRIRSNISSVETDRNDVVKSKINIPNYSVEDIGQYTCTVTNKNYGNKTSRTFNLSYTQSPKVTTYVGPKFYKTPNLPLNLTWNITGWPLNNIKAECTRAGSNSQELVANKNRIDNYSMPLLIFKLNITSPTNATRIYCSITNNGEEIYSNTITRVGHSCSSGTYGEKDKCVSCPKDMISPPQAYEEDQCFTVKSFCLTGMYGVGSECSNCPAGMTSEDFAVKIEECFDRSGVNLGVIIGGSVGVLILIIGVIIGVVCWNRMRRGKGIIRDKEDDINLNLNVNLNCSNPLAKQGPETLYVENTISDPDSALYAQVDHSSRNRRKDTPQNEPIYSDVQNENATYAELDRSTTKRRAPSQRTPATIYSSALQNNMIDNDTTYCVVERHAVERDGGGGRGERVGEQGDEPTYSSIQHEIKENDENQNIDITDLI